MHRKSKLFGSILLSCVNTPVWAHHGAVSTFRFVDGLMHPWSGLDHWLILLGLVLLLNRRLLAISGIVILAISGVCQGLAHIAGLSAGAVNVGYLFGLGLSHVMLIGSIVLLGRIIRHFSSFLKRSGDRTSYIGGLAGFN